MILDHLDNWRQYACLHPHMAAAFEFLSNSDLCTLEPGRHAIDADRVYAVVLREQGRGREQARLEAHREYIDIQFCISGSEEIGYKAAVHCVGDGNGYDEAKDIEFFTDAPAGWAATEPGSFGVFFPADAHAPLAGVGEIRKVVVKIKV